MALPTTKTKPKTDFLTARVAIIGPPKIGKSTFASQLGDGVIFAATESGLDYLEVFQTKIDKYEDFANMVTELTTTKHQFKTVVIDTIDKLIEKAENLICQRNKVPFIKDMPYGAGYTATKRMIIADLDKLTAAGLGYSLIGHCKEKEFMTESIKYTAMATSLGKSYEESVLGQVDFIFYCYSDSSKQRKILTKPTKYVQCAGDRSTKLPEKMDMNAQLVIDILKGEIKVEHTQNTLTVTQIKAPSVQADKGKLQ